MPLGICVPHPPVQCPRPLSKVLVAAPDAVRLQTTRHESSGMLMRRAGLSLHTCGHNSTSAACDGSSSVYASAAPCIPTKMSVCCTSASCSSTADVPGSVTRHQQAVGPCRH